GKICGSLTGGCCLIGYFAGKGSKEEVESVYLNQMIGELVQWFDDVYGKEYGGCDCTCILEGNPINKRTRCPQIVEAVYTKAMELLRENGVIS
ncbi:hypothetical protein CG709_20535, partial [Lachnotalea glycerini]